ncbi:MAG: hypothetical protein PHS14_09540 [Elusimicrobia bacterium]|nr:hypothetical protein [Elusimicrobiota bacterium]
MTIRFEGSREAADADSNFPVAPEGTVVYMTVDAVKESMSRGNPEKGTPPRPMLELELLVSHGEYAGKIRVWNYLTFIEAGAKGHGMTLHALHALGFDPEGENDYSAEAIKGRGVKAELGIETYKGKRKNVIAKFLIDDEPAPEGAPAEDAATSFNPEELEQAPPPAKAASPTSRGATATASRPAAAAPAARKLPWAKKK